MPETPEKAAADDEALQPEVVKEPDTDTPAPVKADVPAPEGAPAPPPEDDAASEPTGEGDEERPGRFARFSRRLWSDRGLTDDAKLLVGAALETSDKVKTEAVKLVAREVRHYLEELKWKDDLKELLTSHELEVHATFSLKPKPATEGARSDETPEE